MQPEAPKLLEDIRDAAEFVTRAALSLRLEDYTADRLLRQAVERNFEIIGEAVLRLNRADPQTAGRISDVRAIVAFRNILVHGYDTIDDGAVWDVIRFKLPVLLDEVRRLLLEASSQQ